MNLLKTILPRWKAKKLFQKGVLHYQVDNYPEALDFFNNSMKLHKNAEVYQFRGLCHFYLGDFAEAIKNLTMSISMSPETPDYYYNRGYVYSENKEFDKSLRDYKKCIDIDESWFEAYYGCACDLFELMRYSDSANFFSKFLEYCPEPAAIQLYRAALCFDMINDIDLTHKLMIQSAELGNAEAQSYCSLNDLIY